MLNKIEKINEKLNHELEEIKVGKTEKKRQVQADWNEKNNKTVEFAGKTISYKEAYELAKKNKGIIISKIKDSDGEEFDSNFEKYNETLKTINEFIVTYENEKAKFESEIEQISYDKSASVQILINNINEIINCVNKEKETVEQAYKSKSITDPIEEIENLKTQYMELLKFEKELKQLLSYKAEINMGTVRNFDLKEEYKSIVTAFYDFIDKSGIDMTYANKENIETPDEIGIETPDEIGIETDDEYEKLLEEVNRLIKEDRIEDYEEMVQKIELSSCSKKEELKSILNEYYISIEKKFESLLAYNNECIEKGLAINEEDIFKMNKYYKYLREEKAKEHEDAFRELIVAYNNGKQEEVKENYEVKKDNFYTSLGKAVSFVKGSKIATKFNIKLLDSINEKLKEDESQKDILNKISSKISKKLISNSIVGGLKLFVSQKKLEKLKPKLYNEKNISELSKRKQKSLLRKYERATRTIEKQMVKGLNAKTSIKTDNKQIASNIIDQYLYLIATAPYYFEENELSLDEHINSLVDYLNSNLDLFEQNELDAISEEIAIIRDYRINKESDFDIYEFESYDDKGVITTELDDVVKYYDSDECKLGYRKSPVYIKR